MYVLDHKVNKRLHKMRDSLTKKVTGYLSGNNVNVTKNKHDICRKSVSCFLLNLHSCILRKNSRFNITLDKCNYSQALIINGQKSKRKVSYQYTRILLDYLIKEEYIILEVGGELDSWGFGEGGVWEPAFTSSFVHVTPKLLELYFSLYGQDEDTTFHYIDNVIVLKDKKGNKITFKMDKYTRETRDYLQNYNKFSLAVDVTAKDGGKLDVQQYQVYNVDFNNGGRSYMKGEVSYQSLSKTERSHVMINNNKTRSLDFKGFEPSLLYSLEQEVMEFDDPYDIELEGKEEYDIKLLRSLTKQCMLIMLNTSGSAMGKRAMNAYIFNKYNVEELYLSNKIPHKVIPVDEIIKGLLTKHHLVAHRFFCMYGNILQNTGAKITDYIVNYFLQRGRLCLQVHDAYRVEEDLFNELPEVMIDAWQSIVGFTDNCKFVEE